MTNDTIYRAMTAALSLLNEEVQSVVDENLEKEYYAVIRQLETALQEMSTDEKMDG